MRILPLLLLLAACGPIVQVGGNTPPPDALLTLRATATGSAPAGPVTLANALQVEVPMVPGTLQTTRVAVTVADTRVQYLPKANWAEQPNRQFARLLGDTLSANGVVVLDARAGGPRAGRVLGGELAEFGLDMRRGTPTVRVRYDAVLVGGGRTATRRFEASAPAAGDSGNAVAIALNQAANALAADVAAWVKGG